MKQLLYLAKKTIKKILRPLFLVNFLWRIKIKKLSLFTRKVKIGFGPITSGENDFAERKWRIDPIIDEINRMSDRYVAGFFISPQTMKKFDRIIIVKKFTSDFISIIEQLKKINKKFIYDIVDNPNCAPEYKSYLKTPKFTDLMDAFILSNPLHKNFLKKYIKPALLIEHPVINFSQKASSKSQTLYKHENEIILLAQGYYENLKNLKILESLLPEISRNIGQKIVLVYHSEAMIAQTEWTRSVKWTVDNCFPIMYQADIAVTIKDLHKLHQKTKPSTKVIAYMAAGLPVICFPTIADRLVIQHRINGLFAYTQDDWKYWITKLAINARLRKQIGKAAKASVIHRYSITNITQKYIHLMDQI